MQQFAAAILESSSKALAGYAASDLMEQHPAAAERFGPHAHRAWQDFFQSRFDELAASLLVRDATLFVSDIAWTKALFHIRHVPLDDLRAALAVMRTIIERELPERVRTAVPEYLDLAEQELASDDVRLPEGIQRETPNSRLAALFLQQILEGERRRASSLIIDAVRDGLPIEDAYATILIPVAREVGRMWHAGEMNVAEEHFATATTEIVMSQLYPHLPRQPRHGKTAIVTAAQGNRHGLAVRFIADYFEMAGWRVIHLGSDLPARDLAQAVEDFQADLVALSVTMSRHLRATGECIDAIRATARGDAVRVLIGGLALQEASNVWQEIGADAAAESGPEAVEVAAKLVGLPTDPGHASAS